MEYFQFNINIIQGQISILDFKQTNKKQNNDRYISPCIVKRMCVCVFVFELQFEQSYSASRPGLPPFLPGKSPLLCLSVWSRWLVLNRLAFSTSKQPHKCTSFALKYVFLKRLTHVYAAVSRTGRLFGNLTRDSPPQCGFITLCCRSVLKNSRGGGNSTQAAQHRRLPLCRPGY